jgi:hypothetical protein
VGTAVHSDKNEGADSAIDSTDEEVPMYGAAIETDFQHIAFENEQLKRKLETRRLLETGEQPSQKRPRRSLVHVFGRLVPRLDLRIPIGRSPITPS